jgi:sigma-B regulation protein RsbU (phosphoserine phosphatase)
VACAIQQSILPKIFPNRAEFELCASMIAARDIGGDFYDFFYIDENHLALVMADVSGKGIPAAIFMAVSRTLVKATALASDGTCSCLAKANELLCAESVDSMFVTLFYSILDIRTGQMRFANAGHNPPYVVHQDGTINTLVVNHGPALGAFPDITYNEASVIIQPGDILYLYTDGVTEATNISEQFYKTERLEGMLKSCAGLSVTDVEQKVLLDVKMFMAGAPQSDDITMMA